MLTLLATALLAAANGPQDCPMHAQQAAASVPASPYAGQETREIKALSDSDVKGYLEGAGMGLARAAELNRYPGPRHLLELAEPLKLSAEQRVAVEDIHARMKSAAVALGPQLVEAERRLDAAFATGSAEAGDVERLSADAAALLGRVRAVHLQAHVEARRLLTPEQIDAYVTLRGYAR
jgi:Spy/CpxP family protein refolding chaperone